MSVQFGKLNFDGKPVDPKDLDQIRPVLTPYGPDREGYISKDNFGILYRAFHTTKESRREIQPLVLKSGALITWDGRLDNRDELVSLVGSEVPSGSTDLEIAALAYERWGTAAFAKLIGDWALSICDPSDRSLILATDFVGTRHLYYAIDRLTATWCSILDPLVLPATKHLTLCEEYLAGWISSFPAPHLTPYHGISSVPPSHFVVLRANKQAVIRYWDFDSGRQIRYKNDQDYEEHFRSAFAESVRRCLRSDAPVLAELSGGMDSSSIVCVADTVIARGLVQTPRLDTLSYYDDSEPNWNELPYCAKVEGKRGCVGLHIDTAVHEPIGPEAASKQFVSTPASVQRPGAATDKVAEHMALLGHRVLLSGIGGDEVTGGVPTPLPELEDLLVQGRLIHLSHRLKVWALTQRKPWLHLLWATLRGFLPAALVPVPLHETPVPWLQSAFVQRNQHALRGYPARLKVTGFVPSVQENLSALDGLRRQLACIPLGTVPLCERRYPYLDRSFLEFMFALPRTQIVRPGQRRSLMRRALLGIVPDEILNRRRKAYAIRSPWAAIERDWAVLGGQLVSQTVGVVDRGRVAAAISEACQGREIPLVPMMRMMSLEFWLRSLGSVLNMPAKDFRTSLAAPSLSDESLSAISR